MEEPLAQQHDQLVLGEGRIEVRPRDCVETEVPRSEPRVLPRVGHREHVEGVEVAPVLVPAVPVPDRRRRFARVAVEPEAHVVRVDLLAPDQAGGRLTQDAHLLRCRLGRCECVVEVIGLVDAAGQKLGGAIASRNISAPSARMSFASAQSE